MTILRAEQLTKTFTIGDRPINVLEDAVGYFTITNECGKTVEDITLSISGNPKVGEFCFAPIESECYASVYPTDIHNETITLADGETYYYLDSHISLYFKPRPHPGKRKKRLNIDGLYSDKNGEVSVSYRILGEASKKY